jgi:hypothetical protein
VTAITVSATPAEYIAIGGMEMEMKMVACCKFVPWFDADGMGAILQLKL